MALVYCPECGTRVSSAALVCPHCGYCASSGDPIGVEEPLALAPVGETPLASGWIDAELVPLAREDGQALVGYFSLWENFVRAFPSIADIAKKLVGSNTEYVAKLTPDLRKLLADGRLRFQFDKSGEMMAILKEGDGNKWVKQLRLEQRDLPLDVTQSLNHLSMTAMMTDVLSSIEEVKAAVESLRLDYRDDRLALAESCRDKLLQAQLMEDSRRRESYILQALGAATDVKRRLMRSTVRALASLRDAYQRNNQPDGMRALVADVAGALVPGKSLDTDRNATELLDDLAALAATAQVECSACAMLGEYRAAEAALGTFRDFITDNCLNQRDTLLMVNEWLPDARPESVERVFVMAAKVVDAAEPAKFEEARIRCLPGPPEERG